MLHAAAHPAFAPFSRWWPADPSAPIPPVATLDAWARDVALALPDGRPLAFVAAPARSTGALDYERRIAERGEVATRTGNRHDFCNALAWLAFPRTKAALNAVHVASAPAATPNARDRGRDAATLLDESGLIVACADAGLVAAWRDHRWREAFGDRPLTGARPLRAVAIGHGLIAKLAAPFPAITGRAVVLPLDAATLPEAPAALAATLDAAAADAIAARGATWSPATLLPLPVAALPGWDTEGQGARLFDDVSVFRLRVLR
ncbi:MAG: DUF3025 domain-containing protein [Betaproteobacteria bacterium]